MTADTLKTTRVLELYQDFLSGKLINKQQAAEQYHVNARSIQRDIDSIRDFLSEQCAKEGIVRKIEYDKKENGYSLVTQEIEQLSRGEVLALCKILLESRAFTKEQVEKQLQIILNLCVSQKEKNDIEWFISNELFNYHDPAHAAVDPDNLWMAAQAIRNQSVLEIEYQKLKDHQIVKRTVETVVLLSHKKPDSYIHIDVEFGEGEGKIPVDKIVQRAEQYKPKERVTYKRIKEYILEKYGFKVHTAYIAEVKRSLGLPMYDAPNAVEKLKQARKHPTPEKVEAIKDALHYFAVI